MGIRIRNERTSFLLLLLMMAIALNLGVCLAATNKQPPKGKQSSSPYGLDSSAIFPVRGNVYPDGLYYVTLNIGDPPKPYYLDVDTGSDLTWLQCDAPCVSCSQGPHPLYKPKKNKLVPCEDPLCSSIRTLNSRRCESFDEQCDYEIEYADKGSSLGVLVKDVVTLRFANGSLLQPHLAFGCGYDQQGSSTSTTSLTDGVLGLGKGRSSIVAQLRDMGLIRNVIGHCFSKQGGGFVFLGDGFVPFSRVSWTPMSRDSVLKHYSPGPAFLYFGRQPLNAKSLSIVFDSGSSYTYFSSGVYQAFVSAVKKDLPGKQLKEAPEDKTLPLCWKGTRRFKSVVDVKKFFKPLVLGFADGKNKLEIPPEGYLIISSYGNVCLGILNSSQNGLEDLNIIGDISMQDVMVIYDNEKQQIGWIPSDCNRLPKSGTALL